jgi:sugar lactone lactonase YvrE
VAGQEGNGGFKDGDFISALFNRPLGLAASSDGTQLFVADSGNQRIRIIHLDQNNGSSAKVVGSLEAF